MHPHQSAIDNRLGELTCYAQLMADCLEKLARNDDNSRFPPMLRSIVDLERVARQRCGDVLQELVDPAGPTWSPKSIGAVPGIFDLARRSVAIVAAAAGTHPEAGDFENAIETHSSEVKASASCLLAGFDARSADGDIMRSAIAVRPQTPVRAIRWADAGWDREMTEARNAIADREMLGTSDTTSPSKLSKNYADKCEVVSTQYIIESVRFRQVLDSEVDTSSTRRDGLAAATCVADPAAVLNRAPLATLVGRLIRGLLTADGPTQCRDIEAMKREIYGKTKATRKKDAFRQVVRQANHWLATETDGSFRIVSHSRGFVVLKVLPVTPAPKPSFGKVARAKREKSA